jgi:predicted HicB family RNase H-like nuclease
MAGGGRADGVEYAERVNAAAELLDAGMSTVESVRELAGRFSVSTRQARRYVEHAAADGRLATPQATTVFTVRLPTALAGQVRAKAKASGRTISALVGQALAEFLVPDRRRRPGQ